jgi:Trk-type K+ transport system membrane component
MRARPSDDLLKNTIRPVHSAFTERTNLSAFKCGDRGGSRTGRSRSRVRAARKVAEYLVSGSLPAAVLGLTLLIFHFDVTLTFALLLSGLDLSAPSTRSSRASTTWAPVTVGQATNYANLTHFQSWIGTVAMILGRLEIFPFFSSSTRAFWRNAHPATCF